jgi:ABC-type nitrate/sulfonate/bicarbonate transport system permease component/ABC-type lipoprotein export system ATPase subunit
MSGRKLLRHSAYYLIGFLLFIGVWWGGSYLAGPGVLPPPSAIADYLVQPGVVASFLGQVALTVGRGVLGFSLAWIAASPLGFLMGRSPTAERIGFFPFFLLQSAPPLFWVTPLVLWLGTRGQVAPAVAFLVSLPLLTVHISSAVRHIPDYEYDVFRVYAPRPGVIARELYVPHLLPAVKSNAHLGLLVAIKAAMLAEWFAAQNGFGQTIRIHYQFFAMTEFLTWAILFLVLIGGLSLLIRTVLNRALPQYRPLASAEDSELPPPEVPARFLAQAQADAPPRLDIRHLTFAYEKEPVLNDVSLSADTSTPVVIHGESGCGKTTLLRCIAGILTPKSGTVETIGRVGLVFQEDALLAHRDALGNVLLPAMPRPTELQIEEARWCLHLWGMGDHAEQYPHELSGGMRKRLAMARAWFHSPDVLLLDEPFVNLDREARGRALGAALHSVARAPRRIRGDHPLPRRARIVRSAHKKLGLSRTRLILPEHPAIICTCMHMLSRAASHWKPRQS